MKNSSKAKSSRFRVFHFDSLLHFIATKRCKLLFAFSWPTASTRHSVLSFPHSWQCRNVPFYPNLLAYSDHPVPSPQGLPLSLPQQPKPPTLSPNAVKPPDLAEPPMWHHSPGTISPRLASTFGNSQQFPLFPLPPPLLPSTPASLCFPSPFSPDSPPPSTVPFQPPFRVPLLLPPFCLPLCPPIFCFALLTPLSLSFHPILHPP